MSLVEVNRRLCTAEDHAERAAGSTSSAAVLPYWYVPMNHAVPDGPMERIVKSPWMYQIDVSVEPSKSGA